MPDSQPGGPDGATVDSQGGLWVAQPGNWQVVRHRPSDGMVRHQTHPKRHNLRFADTAECCSISRRIKMQVYDLSWCETQIDCVIKTPFSHPTSVNIGGETMKTLFITSAFHRLNDEQKAQQPGAGQLFCAELPQEYTLSLSLGTVVWTPKTQLDLKTGLGRLA